MSSIIGDDRFFTGHINNISGDIEVTFDRNIELTVLASECPTFMSEVEWDVVFEDRKMTTIVGTVTQEQYVHILGEFGTFNCGEV